MRFGKTIRLKCHSSAPGKKVILRRCQVLAQTQSFGPDDQQNATTVEHASNLAIPLMTDARFS